MKRSFFGLQDASGRAWDHLDYGSLRLWDSGTSWDAIETTPGFYDWTRLDAYVYDAGQHHTEVVWTIAYIPSFYGPSTKMPPEDAYRNLVTAAMERYGLTIGTYQVWNEANINWSWTDSMANMARLTEIMLEVRDRVCPQAKVLSPSFAVRLRYERSMLSEYLAIAPRCDGLALSLYPMADGGTPEDAFALVDEVRKNATVEDHYPIWVAEINYGVGPIPVPNLSVETEQISNVLRTYLLGAAYRIERLHWYRYDWMHPPEGWLGTTMLSDPDLDFEATPPGLAITTVQQWLDGAKATLKVKSNGVYVVGVWDSHRRLIRKIMWHPTTGVHVGAQGASEVYYQDGSAHPVTNDRIWVSSRPKMIRVQ